MKTNKGFTLVELLIVVSLLSIMTGVVLGILNPSGLRAKARDSQRSSDLEKIRSALELYFADNRAYPTTSGWVAISSVTGLTPTYISTLPVDPLSEIGTVCENNEWRGYGYYSDANTYNLATAMEIASSGNSNCETFTVPCEVPVGSPKKGFVGLAEAAGTDELNTAIVPEPGPTLGTGFHCYGISSP